MSAPTLTVAAGPALALAEAVVEPVPSVDSTLYAAILANLLKENPSLPVLIWSVYPSGLVGRAVGKSDWQVIKTVRDWARAFRVRADMLSAPRVVPRRHTFGDGWAVEPGEIRAQLLSVGYDICVVGELLEVRPGDPQ